MINELEKQFFITMNIKSKKIFKPVVAPAQLLTKAEFKKINNNIYQEISKQEVEVYPKIKDEHILKLLGLVNGFGFANPIKLKACSYDGIKKEVLEIVADLKYYYENHRLEKISYMYQDFKKEVQDLFKES